MRGHHHPRLTDRQWIDQMSERNERAANIRRMRKPPSRPLRHVVRLLLAFNFAVFAFCVYLVAR